jgi:hypothetical protein
MVAPSTKKTKGMAVAEVAIKGDCSDDNDNDYSEQIIIIFKY